MLQHAGWAWSRWVLPFVGFAMLVATPRAGAAQVISPNIAVTLGARKNTVLSVSVLSGGVQSITTLVDGTVNAFPSPVRLQTTWDLNPGQTGSVELVAFFTDPSGALVAGPGARIASSRVEGRVATGLPVSFAPFAGGAIGGIGTAGATLRLFSVRITGINQEATRTDELNLRLNLTGQPNLPIGTYTGTLYIRAVTL